MANRYIGNAFTESLSLSCWNSELCRILCLSKTQEFVKRQWSLPDTKWRGWMISCSIWKLLDALQIWKYMFMRTEIFWVKVRSGEIWLFSFLKALRNIINPNLNRLNHNLYHLELSYFQHLRNKTKQKPKQTAAVKNQPFIMQQLKTLWSWRLVLFSFSFLQF